jgi:hypothetical protein
VLGVVYFRRQCGFLFPYFSLALVFHPAIPLTRLAFARGALAFGLFLTGLERGSKPMLAVCDRRAASTPV